MGHLFEVRVVGLRGGFGALLARGLEADLLQEPLGLLGSDVREADRDDLRGSSIRCAVTTRVGQPKPFSGSQASRKSS